MAIKPFRRVLAANRGEIAVRIFRASTELGFRTVAIFSEEDRVHLHRYKADEAYLVGKGLEPVAAYLAEDEIVELAEAPRGRRHPPRLRPPVRAGRSFARKCRDAGIVFVGPTPEVIDALGDKVAARKIAEAAGVPIVPGTPEPACRRVAEARGVRRQGRLPGHHQGVGGRRRPRHARGPRGRRAGRAARRARARRPRRRSATTPSSSRSWSIRPKHIEVQILGDNHGNLVHLFERDCSVQRRHQKVIEIRARAGRCRPRCARGLAEDALKIARHVNYSNAGTVEFLVGEDGSHYFIEVNPRIQVEHTVTEAITGARPGAGADPDRRRATSCPIRRSASPARTTSSSAASRSRCASPPRIPRNDFLPDTGQDHRLPAGGRASASAWTTARATSARACRRTTTRCW